MFKEKLTKSIFFIAIISTIIVGSFAGSRSTIAVENIKANNNLNIKNVILLIGDGMGVSYSSGYRYYKNHPAAKKVQLTEFDKYLVGQQSTYPDDPNHNITNSAAAGTALATGVKTFNNAIAVDKDKAKLKTVLEAAKEQGKATGLVATSEITHATPASFGAHNEHRKNMNEIADDYYNELVNGKHKIDVLLGGGRDLFIGRDRNLVEKFQKDGYSYVTNLSQLNRDKNVQVLGLFAKREMPKMIDRPKGMPSLKDMTISAMERLNQNKHGFFLMVEGSQIDWAGHDNDIVSVMSEIEDFEMAFKAAIEFAKKDGSTLVIATADHSSGGLSIGSHGEYNWFSAPIKAAKRTPDFMAKEIKKGEGVKETLTKYIDLPLTTKEIQSVKVAAKTKKVANIDNAIEKIFDTRSLTGWTTVAHTGEDVNIYAFGPERERFAGLINNTDIAKIIFDILR